MSPPSKPTSPPASPPDLDRCVQILKRIDVIHGNPSSSPARLAETYAAAIGLMYHLRQDQRRFEQASTEPFTFPKPKEIPAMTAVVNNQRLFQALVSCLNGGAGSSDGSASGLMGDSSSSAFHSAQSAMFMTPASIGSRNRTNSIDGSTTGGVGGGSGDLTTATTGGMGGLPNKSMKLGPGISPHVGKRTLPQNHSSNKHSSNNNNNKDGPKFNVKVLAATILWVAFEPLDHWPAPLVEAYAEDCFGPRSWVDLPECQLLVENLTLIHSTKESGGNDDDDENVGENDDDNFDRNADAMLVADFYRQQSERSRSVGSVQMDTGEDGSSVGSMTPKSKISPWPIKNGNMSVDGAGFLPSAPSLKRKRSTSVDSQLTAASQSMTPTNSERIRNGRSAPSTSGSGGDNDDAGSSSSSGEEEEVDDRSNDGSERLSPKSFSATPPPPESQLTYPLQQSMINKNAAAGVRQRYFGLNLEYAHQAVAEKLQQRLDVKAKQNSGLLQSLPVFTSIPAVRTLITSQLERWLQSPALAGLSRTLFSATVQDMKNVDPPLVEDLAALDNILAMRLKANQLNAHIDNVKAVATKIPTRAVANRIYYQVLAEILATMDDSHDSRSSDHLAMIQAVHEVLPEQIRADGLASAFLKLLVKRPSSTDDLTSNGQVVSHIRRLIEKVAKQFGAGFDAYKVLIAMAKQKGKDLLNSEYDWGIKDEENKARLMFHCATLVVDPSLITERLQPPGKRAKSVAPSNGEVAASTDQLVETRKVLLTWCCNDYAPLCPSSLIDPTLTTAASHSNGRSGRKQKDEVVGAGPADYSSILDGLGEANYPDWLRLMRCLLFMEYPGSPTLAGFLFPDNTLVQEITLLEEESKRIKFCCDYGADLTDEMIRIVLDAATSKKKPMPHDIALMVLEHLFHCCTKDRKPCLLAKDPELVWKLYQIVGYEPPRQSLLVDIEDDTDSQDTKSAASSEIAENGKAAREFQRLAYPGLWWRATCLALILCGASTDSVGAMAFEQHATLRALTKMVTSDRYRFPTVDCDDVAREEQKNIEQEMRDEEARITELLFSPPKKNKKKKKKKETDILYAGHRVSRRQQEKREKMLKEQQAKEEAEARAEASRRRKTLRAAQKSIMLWDPTKGPRKPPKESADLIFSVGELFDLPRVFQRSTTPDFVMKTIGSTSRGAIERAYDWLIPIISFLPDTISRLPASASCFLLLRAYGTEGTEQSQLQELSAPLLQHVHDSLVGNFGKENAVRAFDLLLAEVASHNPDRRRCARRVLQNASSLGTEEVGKVDKVFSKSNHKWVVNMLGVEHAISVAPIAMKHLATAASYERGSNLRYLVFALRKLSQFAIANKIPGEWDFAALLTSLMSRRPTVFAAALISYQELRSLTIHVVREAFNANVANTRKESAPGGSEMVSILLYPDSSGDPDKAADAQLPLALLQSTCVLFSVWTDDGGEVAESAEVQHLVDMMMKSRDSDSSEAHGLAKAKLVGTGKDAIPVESWVMLAKARSDFIAKRAALTAPTSFLPRLLLCSGLPRASLLTMIDRLGKLGENSSDRTKAFNQLLVSNAASEWDIGRLGNRREISRKLLGRLTAYQRMYNLSETSDKDGEKISFAFVHWLPEACQGTDKPTKLKAKFKKPKTAESTVKDIDSGILGSVKAAELLLDSLSSHVRDPSEADMELELDGDTSDMSQFMAFQKQDRDIYPPTLAEDPEAIQQFIEASFRENEPRQLDIWLTQHFHQPDYPKRKSRRRGQDDTPKEALKVARQDVSLWLLQCYLRLERKVEDLAAILVKWVPILSAISGNPKLWKALFGAGQKPAFMWDNLVSRCFQIWTHSHVVECREWMLSEGRNESLDLLKVVRFLIHASTFSVIHVEPFVDLPVATEDSAWGRSEETVGNATAFALECLSLTDCEKRLRSRNDLPEGLVLLLLIARLGKNQVQFVCNAIVYRLQKESDDKKGPLLLLSLLRLYAYFPSTVNLGAAEMRTALKEAVGLSNAAKDWLSWRSPLDDSLQDMLEVVLSPACCTPRAIQTLVDAAKRHPLLLLRKLNDMSMALEGDAVAKDDYTLAEKLGTIVGRSLDGPLVAKMTSSNNKGSKSIKVTFKYWGFNYTESLWMVLLDILSAVPHEVLFDCGLVMGLTDVLGIYLRLVFVQGQLQRTTTATTGTDRFVKLKERYAQFLNVFQSTNARSWDAWLTSPNSGLKSLGVTRNILMSCGFISHKQAIEHVQR